MKLQFLRAGIFALASYRGDGQLSVNAAMVVRRASVAQAAVCPPNTDVTGSAI